LKLIILGRRRKTKKKLNESLSYIVDFGDNDEKEENRLPFITAEDLLKKAKENIESESIADNNIDNRDE